MSNNRSNSGAVGTLVVSAAAIVVGVFLYRRSGRDWNEDLALAQDWLEGRTSDAQKVLDKTEKASKDLLASAQDYGHQAIGTAKGALDGVKDRVGA